jgi:hypothetical protein
MVVFNLSIVSTFVFDVLVTLWRKLARPIFLEVVFGLTHIFEIPSSSLPQATTASSQTHSAYNSSTPHITEGIVNSMESNFVCPT